MLTRTAIPSARGRRPERRWGALAAAALAASGALGGGCTRAEPPGESAFRFIDHLEESSVVGTLPAASGRQVEVFADSFESGLPRGSAATARPFVGFAPLPGAKAAAASWRAARAGAQRFIAAGPDERVAGSRGLRIRPAPDAEFTGVRTAPIPVEPGATYRVEAWVRTDSLELPEPQVGATLLAFGLTLGPDPDSDANERLDESGYFSNHSVLLEELSAPGSRAGTGGWAREELLVRTNRRVDHLMVMAVAHGPQPPGPRGGAARFDDLRVYRIVPPVSALPPLEDHFTGAPHPLKKKVRIGGDAEQTCNAILAPVPGRIDFQTHVAEGARLAMGVAVPPSLAGEGGAVTMAIDVSVAGRVERVFERTLRPGVDDADRGWRRESVDLSPFGGAGATIAFVTERESGGGIEAALWGEPVLYAGPARPASSPRAAASADRCAAAAPAGVLLISIDTLRRDRLGCYGSPRRVTPELDRIAAGGCVYESCTSASSWTLPSHVSMLTALPPSLHRVTADERRLGRSRLTAAEILRRAGFATGAFVTHYYVSGDYGLDRGFESFTYSQEEPASRICARAADWLAANSERPFFCFLHLFDPHWDYEPPRPYAGVVGGDAALSYRGAVDGRFEALQPWIDPTTTVPPSDLRHLLDLYDGEVAAVDAALGGLFARLEQMGLSERTLVIVTSDHGEEFREHGSFGHGHSLYDEVTRVPLVVRAPDRPQLAGAIRDDAVATVDIAPTILDWLAIGPDRIGAWIDEERAALAPLGAASWEPQGMSLLGPPTRRMVLAETERFGNWRMALRDGPLKLLTPARYVWWTGFEKGTELYDVVADPAEREDLVSDAPAAQRRSLEERARRLFLSRHRGVFLVFRANENGYHSAQARIEGEWLVDPTGVGLEAGDVVHASGGGVDVSVGLSPGDLDIVLLRSRYPETVRLTFGWDRAPLPAATLVLGAERRAHDAPNLQIGPGAPGLDPPSADEILAWDGEGVWVLASEEERGTDFALDEEELARLRALGYIR